MSSVEQLLGELDSAREQLLMVIEMLPDDALTQPEVVGDWSIADVLVNLTVWESELVTALMQIEQGKRPTRLLAALAAADTYTQARYEENKGRELDRVFDDLIKVRLELEEWIEMFADRDLADARRYKWLHGRTLAQLISQITIENERRYLPTITAFAQAWQTKEEEMAQEGVIPLTTISILNPTDE
ncbi:MAG TPA: ClbS/DfsB family four-helix bundle protein [Chloroflexota bacterium]|nr:ClbS/DfsB family four-helix bundle protein [Chloroflexota bacterium]HUM68331.1 ClbS/DfsB family four-helix bundle protein [Chloroflexota bacterium]